MSFFRPLRSLGIRAINLIPQADGAQQIGLFQNAKSFETLQKIETQMDTLHRRFRQRLHLPRQCYARKRQRASRARFHRFINNTTA